MNDDDCGIAKSYAVAAIDSTVKALRNRNAETQYSVLDDYCDYLQI